MENSLIKEVSKHLDESFDVKNLIIIEFKRLEYPRLVFFLKKSLLVENFENNQTFLSDVFVIEKHAIYAELVDGSKIALKEIIVNSDRYLLIFETEDDKKAIHLIKRLERRAKRDFNWKEEEVIKQILKLILTVKSVQREFSKRGKFS